VTPAVTLAAVWITLRATNRRDRRTERRRAAVDHRETVQNAFEIHPTGPYTSHTPDERDLELALIDLGFRRFHVSEITRQLYDHRKDKDAYADLARFDAATVKQLTVSAERTHNWRALQEVLGLYMNGEISLYRARRKLFGYPSVLRRQRRAPGDGRRASTRRCTPRTSRITRPASSGPAVGTDVSCTSSLGCRSVWYRPRHERST
jgi:hypothetical protein